MTLGLSAALRREGHDVEIVTIPFRFSPTTAVSSYMDIWSCQNFDSFDCGKIDHVIALKFPAYYLTHSNKTIWLMHQHRSVYELFETPFGESSAASSFREKLIKMDSLSLSKARAVFTISRTVSDRLKKYNEIESRHLYQPPPNAEYFQPGPIYPYIFFPSRLEALKRQDLLIRAMVKVKEPVFAIVAGDGGRFEDYQKLIRELDLEHRVKLIGRIDFETMRRYYSNSLGVFFGPMAEDYGFVTLESMLSAKPVITCTDSGGPTEFLIESETGYIVEPEPSAVAEAINRLWADRNRAEEMGRNGLVHFHSLDIGWPNIVKELLGN